MSTSTIRTAKEIVEFTLDNNLKRALLFLGAAGIGKSEFIQEVKNERNMGFVDLRLLLYSETDLKGIPFPNDDKTTTLWLQNDILPTVEKDGETGILLLEEITSAPKRVQTAAYQLVLDRKLGSYSLPDGWTIIAAGNREEDGGVYSQLPAPLANRFEIHELSPDLDIWKQDYAYKNNVNTQVIAYLNFSPASLHTREESDATMVFASPRSWVAVSDILNAGGDVTSKMIQRKIEGNVGEIEAAKFIEFLKHRHSLIDAEKVLSGEIKTPPKDKSLILLTLSSLASTLSYLRTATELTEEDKTKLNYCFEFLTKLNSEFTALGLKDVISTSPKLIKQYVLSEQDSDAILTFIEENDYLF